VPEFVIEEEITLRHESDITGRANYQSEIKPQKRFYTRVLAVYDLDTEHVSCGVSGCKNEHSQGFLVTVKTSENAETNLCEDCGKQLLEVSFEEEEKSFQNRTRINKQKTRLNGILVQNEEIKGRIKELKQLRFGANWLYKSQTNFNKAYPVELLKALQGLAENRGENTTDTPCDEELSNSIQGLGIFLTNIRDVLIGNLLKPLKELEEIVGNPDSDSSLTNLCKWADNLENHFSKAEHLIAEGTAFFSTSNMEKLKEIPLPKKASSKTQSLLWDINGAVARSKK
jgi:hypothetical protein